MSNFLNAIDIILNQQKAIKSLQISIIDQQKEYEDVLFELQKVARSNYSRRIVISGVGKNSNIASKASETFASLGIPTLPLNASHYSHGDAGFIGYDDFVILISKSGKTEEILFMAKHLKEIRPCVETLLIHCNSDLSDEIKDLFTYTLGIDGIIEADENQLAPTSSTTVILILLDTIGINLSKHIKFTPQDFYSYHPGGSLGHMLSGK